MGSKRVLAHPDQMGAEPVHHEWRWAYFGKYITARGVHFARQRERYRLTGNGVIEIAIGRYDSLDSRPLSGRENLHRHVGMDFPASDQSAIAPKTGVRTIHPLHRHAEGAALRPRRDLNLLEMLKQGKATIPIHAIRAGDNVVTAAGRHWNEHNLVEVEVIHERAELGFERSKLGLRPSDEVHLIDSNDE